jgi:predicted ribosome quality control (RQC) complex YloA/Tae2 family protein
MKVVAERHNISSDDLMTTTQKTIERGLPRVYQYELPGGWRVIAGKTDTDNDLLTFKIAKPHDWWFHVRGTAGSHVILMSRPDEKPDNKTLKRAASIAAYHSKAREGGVVAVSCTLARYVKKPSDVKPGTVEIRKESVFKVRPALPEK